jgi:hypothetical protein
MQVDPVTIMVDTALRYVAIEAFQMMIWIPVAASLVVLHAYLHARWTSKR